MQEMGQVCASAVCHLPPVPPGFLGFFRALAQFSKGRSGPEVKGKHSALGEKTNECSGERALHPHLGVGGEGCEGAREESHER